jgi:pilus assembly protein Flp/PilA
MENIRNKLYALLREEEGLTTVEYAIAGSLVGLAVVSAFGLLGDAVGQVIEDITTCISTGVCP